MEQKMLLPIVVIVLVGGFVIGYYAASFGGLGKARPGAPPGETALLETALEDTFVVAAAYVESVVGYAQSVSQDSITLSREGKTVTLPLAKGNTGVLNIVNGRRVVVPLAFIRANDYVNIRTVSNADTKQLVSTSIIILKRASA